jgi:hypothetical protein
MTSRNDKIIIGWCEWLALPELGIPAIRAKMDTGARTSALHTFSLEKFEENGHLKVRFGVHPLRHRTDVEIFCVADVVDERTVSNSGGQREERLVVRTPVRLGEMEWKIEITLTNRESMRFRMLLGRTAMHGRLIVDPDHSYLLGHSLRYLYATPQQKRQPAK